MKSISAKKILSFFLFGVLLLSISLPMTMRAEIINPENSVSLSIMPKNPGANSEADATIESYLLDLNKAKITWFVNGAMKQTAVGKLNFSFTTGTLGKTTSLKVVIDTIDGTHTEKELSIKSANVDLTWEALSYTPPFYKGKSLFPTQGTVKIVALPDLLDGSGAPITSDKLLYKWTQDRQVMGDYSGYGKDSYIFTGDLFARPVNIKVEVSSLAGNQTAEKTITLSPTSPKVSFYENDPLFGMEYEKSLSHNFSLSNQEIKIEAVPYFFNSQDPLTFSWNMNGNPFSDGQSASGRSVVLRQGGQAGTALISLIVKNTKTLLQSVNAETSLFLTTAPNTNAAKL